MIGETSEVLRIDANSTQDEGSYGCGVQMINIKKRSEDQVELNIIGV